MIKPDYISNIDWQLLTKKYKKKKLQKMINIKYPIQYLIGNVDFYGYKIIVNKNVLIPRFETETLVEKTIKYLKKYHLEEEDVLEIGTGSGCISIVLKKEIPSLNITSIDKSIKALKIAKKNLKNNRVSILLKHKNIFKYKPIKKFTILISNPPYVSHSEQVDISTKYEPQNAIFAKKNGIEFYEYIIKNHQNLLQDKYFMAFEIGYKQGNILKKIALKYLSNAKIDIEQDLSGKDRYLFITNL